MHADATIVFGIPPHWKLLVSLLIAWTFCLLSSRELAYGKLRWRLAQVGTWTSALAIFAVLIWMVWS